MAQVFYDCSGSWSILGDISIDKELQPEDEGV
jgi:hypothetical protein